MKNILFALILISAVSTCYSQQMSYGPMAGIIFSSTKTDDSFYSTSGGTGYNIGFFFIADLKAIFLQTDPTFASIPFTVTPSGATSFTTQQVRIPLLIGKKFSQFRLFTGVSPTFVLNATEAGSLDFILGAGVDASKLIFNLRYATSLSGHISDFSPTIKMDQIVLNVGIKLNN